jgi:4-hydroxy-tetrahydrodipicolinate synthase
MEFKGIFGATVLPLDDEGEEINWSDYERLVSDQKKAGVSGVVANAHAGQGELLSREEKIEIIHSARNVVGADYPIVAGIESPSTRDLVVQAGEAVEAGADALMLCAPPLFAWHATAKPEFGIAQIAAVAKAMGDDVPLVLFQYSANNPYYYSPATLAEICERIPQVKAIKFGSSGDVLQFEEDIRTVRSIDRKVAVLPSSGRTFYYTFQMKPDGALSGSANFLPEHDVEMFEAVQRGDLLHAKKLHDEVYPIFSLVYRQPYVNLHIRYTYCTWLLGKIASPALRSPLQPLEAHEIDELRAGLEASGLTTVH